MLILFIHYGVKACALKACARSFNCWHCLLNICSAVQLYRAKGIALYYALRTRNTMRLWAIILQIMGVWGIVRDRHICKLAPKRFSLLLVPCFNMSLIRSFRIHLYAVCVRVCDYCELRYYRVHYICRINIIY